MLKKITNPKIVAFALCSFLFFIGASTTVFGQAYKTTPADQLIQQHLEQTTQNRSQAVQYKLGDEIMEKQTQIRRIYAQQQVNGIDVKDAILGLHFAPNGQNAVSDQFADIKVNTTSPSISAEQALRSAMSELGGFPVVATLIVKDEKNDAQQTTSFDKGDIAGSDFLTRLIYAKATPTSTEYQLVWETQLFTRDRQHYWVALVDASTGKILNNRDMVLHCSFGGVEYDHSEAEAHMHDAHEHEKHLAAAFEFENMLASNHAQEEAIPSAASSMFNTSAAASSAMMGPNDEFLVLAFPADSPEDPSAVNTQTTVAVHDVGSADASPNGWTTLSAVPVVVSPGVGIPGVPITIPAGAANTIGNNVYAFYDASPGPLGGAPSTIPTPPTTVGTDGSTWSYPWDLTEEPEYTQAGLNTHPNRNAAIVNLFYANNMMHDIFYGFGFDEDGRNFQFEQKPGTGGVGSDGVLAQAQDGGGTNNANMLTLADGVSGQMQMYLWSAAIKDDIVYIDQNIYDTDYDVPGGIVYEAIPGSFPSAMGNPDLSTPRRGAYVVAQGNSTLGSTPGQSEGCGASTASGAGLMYDNAGDMMGNIAVIDRGSCSFVEKVVSAQLSNAIAAVVINNVPGAGPAGMGGSDGTSYVINIPSVMISFEDGKQLKNAIAAAEADDEQIMGELFLASGVVPKRDGDFDNGVIAHEYGHGISTRLSIRGGGLGTLGGDEQGGEGWSDFWGLYITLTESDLVPHPNHPNGMLPTRGIGNYVTYRPEDGPGIRPRPYSIDPAVNEYTYAGSLNGSGITGAEITVPHGVGFIWCSMLYDVLQEFIDVYGINDDLYNTGLDIDTNSSTASGGNNIWNRLILEGLKLQASSGSFSDQRDAILMADKMLFPSNDCGGSVHFEMIWRGFAKRGLGYHANTADYGTNALGDETDSFQIPPECGGAPDPGLEITKSAPYIVNPDGTVTYTISVTAVGVDAPAVVLTDDLPTDPNVTFNFATDGVTPSGGVLTWTIGTIPEGQTVAKQVTLNIAATPSTTINSFDDIESGASAFTESSGVGAFAGNAGDEWTLVNSGAYRGNSAWFVRDPGNFSEQMLTYTLDNMTDGSEDLVFFHRYATEAGFDGGVVEYTTGAGWTMIPGSDFSKHPYNDNIPAGNNTQIVGEAFGGNSNGYVQSQASLPFGVTAVRFRFAADVGTAGTGWWIDDIMVGATPTYVFNTATATSGVVTESSTATSLVTGNVLPIQLMDFTAQPVANDIRLDWTTATESDNKGFGLERRAENETEFTQIAWIKGEGTSQEATDYDYLDTDVKANVTYYYQLRQEDINGKVTYSPIRTARINKSDANVTLVPNPSNGVVAIEWSQAIEKEYQVQVTGVNGQVLMTKVMGEGSQQLRLDLSAYPSNIYFVKMVSNDEVITRKLILNK